MRDLLSLGRAAAACLRLGRRNRAATVVGCLVTIGFVALGFLTGRGNAAVADPQRTDYGPDLGTARGPHIGTDLGRDFGTAHGHALALAVGLGALAIVAAAVVAVAAVVYDQRAVRGRALEGVPHRPGADRGPWGPLPGLADGHGLAPVMHR